MLTLNEILNDIKMTKEEIKEVIRSIENEIVELLVMKKENENNFINFSMRMGMVNMGGKSADEKSEIFRKQVVADRKLIADTEELDKEIIQKEKILNKMKTYLKQTEVNVISLKESFSNSGLLYEMILSDVHEEIKKIQHEIAKIKSKILTLGENK